MTALTSSAPYAARLTVDYPERLNRLTTFFRMIWILPIAFILSLVRKTSTTSRGIAWIHFTSGSQRLCYGDSIASADRASSS
jgi:hypothetical protein